MRFVDSYYLEYYLRTLHIKHQNIHIIISYYYLPASKNQSNQHTTYGKWSQGCIFPHGDLDSEEQDGGA